ncbi:MAG: hypothetical protein AAF497_13510 [Planctomycetota bacterium]
MRRIKLPNSVLLSTDEINRLQGCVLSLIESDNLRSRLKKKWKVTRAEFCESEKFVSEMNFFGQNHPQEYGDLIESIGTRSRNGVFCFQLPRSRQMASLPLQIIGELLTVIVDEEDIQPIWELTSLLSGY